LKKKRKRVEEPYAAKMKRYWERKRKESQATISSTQTAPPPYQSEPESRRTSIGEVDDRGEGESADGTVQHEMLQPHAQTMEQGEMRQ
jgi:hypothetical protein